MQSNSLEKRFGNKQYDDKNSPQNHKKLVRKFLTSKYQHFFSNEKIKNKTSHKSKFSKI